MLTTDKKCPRCGVVLPRSEFGGNGSSGWCKKCQREYAKAKYHGNAEYREKYKAYHREKEREKRADPEKNGRMLAKLRERYASDPTIRERAKAYAKKYRTEAVWKDLANQASRRARRDGRECTVTQEYVRGLWDASPACSYCGVQLEIGDGAWSNTSPSLDRIDPSGGYTPQNVALSCWRCNNLKRDATADEIEALAVNFRRVSAARAV